MTTKSAIVVSAAAVSATQRPQSASVPLIAPTGSPAWWWYHTRVAVAGGVAGSVATATLFPLDAAKTLRQAAPDLYPSVRVALWKVLQRGTAYAGVGPAAGGALPSSALYFCAYETTKSLLLARQQKRHKQRHAAKAGARVRLHASAACAGNVLSSAVFVPKEFWKQQRQMGRSVADIWKAGGFYQGYQATLLRNIPTAAIRFVLYEELKVRWQSRVSSSKQKQPPATPVALFVAGAVAGGTASFVMTPVDVLKTRLSTGTCPVDANMVGCVKHVVATVGWRAMYAGAASRVTGSALFGAVGFGTFEVAKRWLGVSTRIVPSSSTNDSAKMKRNSRR